MNPSPQAPDPAAEDQAALWAARLEGSSFTPEQRAALDSWLDGDPGRRELLSGYQRFSAGLDRLVPELAASGRVEIPAEKAPARTGGGARGALAGRERGPRGSRPRRRSGARSLSPTARGWSSTPTQAW